jgi:hypothetical protein
MVSTWQAVARIRGIHPDKHALAAGQSPMPLTQGGGAGGAAVTGGDLAQAEPPNDHGSPELTIFGGEGY